MLTRDGSYEVNTSLGFLEDTIARYKEECFGGDGLNMTPDFQRGHVWTDAQRIAYMEFFLKGGMSGRVIYLNHPYWMETRKLSPGAYCEFVVVDGLQRLTTFLMFIRGELPAFGHYNLPKGGVPVPGRNYFEDPIRMARANSNLKININNLKTKAEVLKWYLEMNEGGTPHSDAELEKVRLMIEKEQK